MLCRQRVLYNSTKLIYLFFRTSFLTLRKLFCFSYTLYVYVRQNVYSKGKESRVKLKHPYKVVSGSTKNKPDAHALHRCLSASWVLWSSARAAPGLKSFAAISLGVRGHLGQLVSLWKQAVARLHGAEGDAFAL